jgi:hypothetical protein
VEFWLGQRLLLLRAVASPSLVLEERDDAVQIGLRQPLLLLCQISASFAQVLLTGVPFLGEPVTTVCSLQRLAEALGMGQHRTQILPHERLALPGGKEARRTPRRALGMDGLGLA